MKASKAASVIAALLASDAKPTEAKILAAILAADKKGKDAASGELEKKDRDEPTGDAEGEGSNPEGKPKGKDKAKDGKAKDKDCAEGAVDEKDDEKAEDEFPEKGEKAKDADLDESAEDEDNGGLAKADVTSGGGKKEPKPAQDTAAIVQKALADRDALHEARAAVASTVGKVALDSAAEVYKVALKKLGVATDGIHPSALKALFEVARDKANAAAPRAHVVGDAAQVSTMETGIKGYGRLK